VRAAIAVLFSHLDGVVSEVFDALRTEGTFNPYLPKRPEFCSLKAKMSAVAGFLAHERGVRLPAVDLDIKLLRDIVNHPSVTKGAVAAGSSETVLYDGADVYGIAIEDLTATASAVDRWLNAVCGAAGYERFRDTKRLCGEFARAVAGTPGSVREF
jgi:hypothetical protein